ncbi:MAG: hypothetical protein ACFE8J_11090 [Candidatus Heimdallarchaeota archaeon]
MKKLIFFLFILIQIFSSTLVHIPLNNHLNMLLIDNNQEEKLIYSSDVAGTDLYAESIDVFVSGNKSIIKQSLFTNDTSILPQFDTRDPAFYKCNVLISASNGITPKIFPMVLNENEVHTSYGISFNGFSGFLYYEEELSLSDIQRRAERALEIIKRKFRIDLITLNISNPYFFPFVGYYPDWETFLFEITNNVPKDGYWKAFALNRLINPNYYQNSHLSSTFLLVNSLDLLEKDFLHSLDQVDFNIDSLDLSYLENLELENIFESFINVFSDYESIFGNFSDFFESNDTVTEEDLEGIEEIGNILSLSNDSHYASLMIQYEGFDEAITQISQKKYSFNLWDALGFNGNELRPSEKIFISITGAFMSGIDVQILCTDIIDQTPQYFKLYDFLLEQIGLLLFYAGYDFNIETLEDYSFELFWFDENGIKRNYIKPINLNESTDYINFLPLLGFQGVPGIPTGLFNPIDDLIVSYNISNSESNMIITKELIGDQASYGANNTFSFNITATNISNETCWGVPTHFPLELEEIFSYVGGDLGLDLMDAIWEVVRVEYYGEYDSLEDFFNFDEKPRIFYFDTTGLGIIDTYFPDITNITNLIPYNEKMDNVIDILAANSDYDLLFVALNLIGISTDDLKDIFTNNASIWNDDNWYINPGERLSYEFSNFSIGNYDTFTSFYENNFTIKETFPELPAIISGISINNTNSTMALENDNRSWIIQSEEKYIDTHEIEIQFLFQNDTIIDLSNNSLDRVSIVLNFTDPSNNVYFEIFNFSNGEFQDTNPFLSSSENDTLTFSFTKGSENLEWLFDPTSRDNHSIVFRIIGSDNDIFNISINDLNVNFSYRDINEAKVLGSQIFYSSFSGNVEYSIRSNTVSLSTNNMASIVTNSSISSYSSKVGEINTYTLNFKNIGSEIAENINISILIPGIIQDVINFTIKDDYLYYYLSSLAPYEQKTIKFSFYTPNSGKIKSTLIKYNTSEYVENVNGTELTSQPNQVFYSAPVDYSYRIPFLNTIEFHYNSSNYTPSINEIFNLTITAFNIGLSGLNLSEIYISINDRIGDLVPIYNNHILINQLSFNTSVSFNITIKKEDWKGYYYSPINFIEHNESRTIQIAYSDSIVLGSIQFLIKKTVDKNQIEIGDIITVAINVTNTGTICIKNVALSDILGFTSIEFNLIEGRLINEIDCLVPGESINFSYKIKAISQQIVKIKPSFIEYYYLIKIKDVSNQIEIKIIIPKTIQMLFIIITSSISITILSLYLNQAVRYKKRKYQTQRNERYLFKRSPRDSILRIENTLIERLYNISGNDDKEVK